MYKKLNKHWAERLKEKRDNVVTVLSHLGVTLTEEQLLFPELEQFELEDEDFNPSKPAIEDNPDDIYRTKAVLDLTRLSFMLGISLTEELKFPDGV